ncbi:MAG TPA: glycosyltransferase family 1 protein [Solirubrobacteraceae bacterium]|nr:glycosyltransferase family 1 protein [Solirubrobacteraceae bacterium]
MRVLIDTTYSLRGPSGTATYLHELVPALRALGVDVVEAANERRRPPAGGGPGSVRNLLADRAWTSAGLRAQARDAGVVHHPLPAHSRLLRVPQVVTVHDLAFELMPERFDRRYAAWARRAHRTAARRAAAVIAVSEATATAVRERWGVPAGRVVVAPHGPGQGLPRLARPSAPRHWLYVGDGEPRKDLPTLLDAYAQHRARTPSALPLVLAGSTRAAAPGVEVVERPAPQALAELYAQAAALVHPALLEGFGLTPLEAMAAGTPVIAARAPGVEEVCGDAALLVAPGDARALADALDQLHADAWLQADLAARGAARARDFTWERSARAHIVAYTLAADHG